MWEKIAHRLTADFLVGDRVFEIVLESLGLSPEPSDQQLRSWLPRFREPHHSPLSGSAFAYRYRVMGICPCMRLTMGLRKDFRPRLGLEGPQIHVFRGSSAKLPTKWAKPRQNSDEPKDFWGNAASR